MTININSEQGNVFCILGHAKSIQKQLKAAGTNDSVIDDVLTNCMSMTYIEILDKLESTGFFKFTGRKK